MNTRELENKLNEVDNRMSRKIEDLRESVNKDFVQKSYYSGKHEILVDKVVRFEKVLGDAYITMNDFTAHKGRVTLLEGEIDKLGKQIELVDAKSENRHDKVMNALETGLNKIDARIESKSGRTLSSTTSVISIISMLIVIVLTIIQHFHP